MTIARDWKNIREEGKGESLVTVYTAMNRDKNFYYANIIFIIIM